ncbi:glycine--tRNA ligase [Candidatus Micrarchaeota archaeon]|nr:glycine--tRNA ligase [Candidatus Micrarchaeota archaeon]
MSDKLYDKILEIALKRSILIPSAELYNAVSGFYDYGPIGVLIKKKIETVWKRMFIKMHGFHEIESATIYPEIVFRASGHAEHFADPIVTCKKCGMKWRADKLLEERVGGSYDGVSEDQLTRMIKDNNIKCPKCNGELTDVARFALMFKTTYGGESKNIAYLRPETAQGMFLDFQRIFATYGSRLPMGLGQVGKSYRNEISPRRILIRLREFTQMELEYFFNPEIDDIKEFEDVKDVVIPIMGKDNQNIENITVLQAIEKGYITNKIHGYFVVLTKQFYDMMGVKEYRFRQLNDSEKAHYAVGAVDLEVNTSFGWIEAVSLAHRGDYDLSSHSNLSKKNLSVFDDKVGKKVMPNVIEPSFGFDRLFWCVLESSYRPVTDEKKWEWFDLPMFISPYHAAVYPLVKKEPLVNTANDILRSLRGKGLDVIHRATGSIGRRYARADEIGVAYCITVDFDTQKDNTVTLRFRNDGRQVRVPINRLYEIITLFTDNDVRTLGGSKKVEEFPVVK